MYFKTNVNNLLYLSLILGYANCYTEVSIFEDVEDIIRQGMPVTNGSNFTVPGTKWCGPGYTAVNYNDLGRYRDTDMCCREHDHCEGTIEPQENFHGIHNTDKYPIMNCHCEQKFITCLRAVNSVISSAVGYVYFGVRSKCFDMGHPIVGCIRYQVGAFLRRCIRYNVDEKRSKIWQLYDMPLYSMRFRNISEGDGGEDDIEVKLMMEDQ